jgi:hypothetical protein
MKESIKKDLESKVQAKIIKSYEKKGYYVVKLISTNKNGIGDLLCLPCINSGNDILFVEAKQFGKNMSPLQRFRAKEIEEKTGIKTIKIDKI